MYKLLFKSRDLLKRHFEVTLDFFRLLYCLGNLSVKTRTKFVGSKSLFCTQKACNQNRSGGLRIGRQTYRDKKSYNSSTSPATFFFNFLLLPCGLQLVPVKCEIAENANNSIQLQLLSLHLRSSCDSQFKEHNIKASVYFNR